jgi:hypothetical protein
MKRLLSAVFAVVVAAPAFASDVSASIGISQPGFYGQINIGDFPRPAVIYAQPVWVQRPQKVVYVQPVYLHVPPGHEKHWSKHCGKYGACGRPVYFVREDWYQTHYVPRNRQQHEYENYSAQIDDDRGHDEDHGSGKGNKGKGKGKSSRDD